MSNLQRRSAPSKLATVHPFRAPERAPLRGTRSKLDLDRTFGAAVAVGRDIRDRYEARKRITGAEIEAAKAAVTAAYVALEEFLHGFHVDFRNRCWFEQACSQIVEVDRFLGSAFPDPEALAEVVSLAKARRAAAKRRDDGGAA